jgi:hypothetical protein
VSAVQRLTRQYSCTITLTVCGHLGDFGAALMALLGKDVNGRSAVTGKKELIGPIDGVRESAQSWKGLLPDRSGTDLQWRPSRRPCRSRAISPQVSNEFTVSLWPGHPSRIPPVR